MKAKEEGISKGGGRREWKAGVLKGCLSMQFNREEKSRLEAERREYMALKELEMLRSALATSRQRHHEVQPSPAS